jgi:hypothetical protein
MKSVLFKVGIGLLIVIVAVFLFFYFANYSSGTRAGIVMKISKKGILFKTNEGMLDVGTINDPWDFSVASNRKEVLEKLYDVQKTGERVQLHYQEKYVQLFWRGDTKHFVVKVEKMSEPPN